MLPKNISIFKFIIVKSLKIQKDNIIFFLQIAIQCTKCCCLSILPRTVDRKIFASIYEAFDLLQPSGYIDHIMFFRYAYCCIEYFWHRLLNSFSHHCFLDFIIAVGEWQVLSFSFLLPPFLFLFQMLYFIYSKKQIKVTKHYVNQKNTSRRCRHDFKYF